MMLSSYPLKNVMKFLLTVRPQTNGKERRNLYDRFFAAGISNGMVMTGLVCEKAEEAFKTQYPSVYHHLYQYKEQLSARNKAETGIRYEWYALQRWGANYWEDFYKPKIIYGQFQDGAEYSFAESGIFLSSNEYMLITPLYSAKCLLAFLNSKAQEWLLGQITGALGGNAKIGQKSNFLKLSVAVLTEEQQHHFEEYVDAILANRSESVHYEALINNEIYKIYGLSENEIALIESQ